MLTVKNKAGEQKSIQGQAMILTVLAIGGAVMGVTAIAGLLMLNQIRATTDASHSTQAIFAADAGVNWALFDYFCNATNTNNPTSRCILQASEQPKPTLSDGALPPNITCYDASNNALAGCSATSTSFAVSIGTSLTSKRAFSLYLGNVTTTP